jgi:hypothetical protein
MRECGLRLHLPLQEFVALGKHPVHVSQSGSGEVLQGGGAISGADNDAALNKRYKYVDDHWFPVMKSDNTSHGRINSTLPSLVLGISKPKSEGHT